MGSIWYECKVKYRKLDESGIQRIVTESYLVDALSYTEAESIITREMTALLTSEFKITNIKVANFSELIPCENSDIWFKAKVSLTAYDEESGKERKTNLYVLAQANNAKQAYESVSEEFKKSICEFSIPLISETKIVDYFAYQSDEVLE